MWPSEAERSDGSDEDAVDTLDGGDCFDLLHRAARFDLDQETNLPLAFFR